MKKWYLFTLAVILSAALLIFSGCAAPTSGTSTSEKVEEGFTVLNSGDVNDAKETFEGVLSQDPDNPEANAGMGLILTFESLQNIEEILGEDILQALSSFNQLSSPSSLKTPNFTSESFLSFAKFFLERFPKLPTRQSENLTYEELLQLLRNLHDSLSDAENHLKIAIKGKAQFNFHVNALDWDRDGTSEPYEPLKITDGTYTYNLYEILNGLTFVSIPTIDQSGGDAWFDFETLSAALQGEELPASAIFTDSDYVVVDEGELALILAFVDILKAIIDIPLTWSFTLPEDFPDLSNYVDLTDWEVAVLVLEYIDKKGDGNIDYKISNFSGDGGEWNALDTFLTFNNNEEEYLADLAESVQRAAWAVVKLDEDVESDYDIHDLTSRYYVEDVVNDEIEGQLLNFAEYGTFTYEDPYIIIMVHLNVLKDHPERFDDLKNYFPTLEWDDDTGSIIPTYLPDETFGGLIEIEEIEHYGY